MLLNWGSTITRTGLDSGMDWTGILIQHVQCSPTLIQVHKRVSWKHSNRMFRIIRALYHQHVARLCWSSGSNDFHRNNNHFYCLWLIVKSLFHSYSYVGICRWLSLIIGSEWQNKSSIWYGVARDHWKL